jgi:hypothetical protein
VTIGRPLPRPQGTLAMFETLPETDAQPAPVSKARPQRQAYQPDLLGAPVVDLELHKAGSRTIAARGETNR